MRAVSRWGAMAAAAGLLLTGCGAGGLAAVRKQASTEMSCPDASVQVTSASPNTEAGPYYAQGCAQLRRYTVGCNIFGFCPEPRGVDALDLLQRQAAFDLKCERAGIAVDRLNSDTFGARGCGRQASYVLLCGTGDCKVVQNTQAQ
jgi:hypothetical protein